MLDYAAGRASPDLFERTPARSVDPREPEDAERQPGPAPRLFRCHLRTVGNSELKLLFFHGCAPSREHWFAYRFNPKPPGKKGLTSGREKYGGRNSKDPGTSGRVRERERERGGGVIYKKIKNKVRHMIRVSRRE